MQSSCPNPNCGAAYNLTPQHTGRTFVCKNCGWTLLVTPSGLERAQPATAAEGGIQEAAAGWLTRDSRDRPRGEPLFPKILATFRADIATWLFRIGLFLAIICLFFALLDRAKVDRRKIPIEIGDKKHERLIAEAQRKLAENLKGEERARLQEELKKRQKDQTDWQTGERLRLQEEVESAGYSARRWDYWYKWGMMWSFLFLGFAALGYLMPEQPMMRRIVAAVVLCGMILFIFIRFVFVETR